mgnify:CR=1 FL=1
MLVKENTGLIVIDIQGRLANLVYESSTLISNCVKLITGAQVLNLPILWLEQNPTKLGPTVPELSVLLTAKSSNLIESLPDKEQHSLQQPIEKFSFDACKEDVFMQSIQNSGVDNWLICGIEAHVCVYQTALNLKRNGLEVQLVTDCISSRNSHNKQLAISKLVRNGIELTGLEMCLFEFSIL